MRRLTTDKPYPDELRGKDDSGTQQLKRGHYRQLYGKKGLGESTVSERNPAEQPDEAHVLRDTKPKPLRNRSLNNQQELGGGTMGSIINGCRPSGVFSQFY